MTPVEARKKWCHKTVQYLSAFTDTGLVVKEGPSRCLATDCMAWRQNIHPMNRGKLTDDEIRGYCGLAGKPGHG